MHKDTQQINTYVLIWTKIYILNMYNGTQSKHTYNTNMYKDTQHIRTDMYQYIYILYTYTGTQSKYMFDTACITSHNTCVLIRTNIHILYTYTGTHSKYIYETVCITTHNTYQHKRTDEFHYDLHYTHTTPTAASRYLYMYRHTIQIHMGYPLYEDTQYEYTCDTHTHGILSVYSQYDNIYWHNPKTHGIHIHMGYSLYDDAQYKCTWDTHTLGTHIRMGYSLDTLSIWWHNTNTHEIHITHGIHIPMGYSLYAVTQYKHTWDINTHTHGILSVRWLNTSTYGIHIHMGYSLDTLSMMAYDDIIHIHMGYTCTWILSLYISIIHSPVLCLGFQYTPLYYGWGFNTLPYLNTLPYTMFRVWKEPRS